MSSFVKFIKQFFPTRAVPKEIKVMTDKEIEETIKYQLEVRITNPHQFACDAFSSSSPVDCYVMLI